MRIGVLCSGGDAPGMNACVRAVVRRAIAAGHEVIGIRRGYQGLGFTDFYRDPCGEPIMRLRSVSGWSRFGGAFLHSSRCKQFRTEAGLKKAAANLQKHGIEALVAIGGDGTFRGAVALAQHWNGQIVGCPATICSARTAPSGSRPLCTRQRKRWIRYTTQRRATSGCSWSR